MVAACAARLRVFIEVASIADATAAQTGRSGRARIGAGDADDGGGQAESGGAVCAAAAGTGESPRRLLDAAATRLSMTAQAEP